MSRKSKIIRTLENVLGKERVLSGKLWREIYSRDASYYSIMPECVVRPENAEQVRAVIAAASRQKLGVTFRSGGTSLCGQSLGQGIICELRTDMKHAEVRDGGRRIWFEPGLTVNDVNHLLRPHHHKIGPDPASSRAAMMGGVLANNSSGMEAGVRLNSYHTLHSIEFILANGHRYDTAIEADRKRFLDTERDLCRGLLEIRREILEDPETLNRIKRKYEIKNVTGYAMNSFVDFDDPVDIFSHLLIGSEGTLAYIVSGELDTVPVYDHYSSAMLYFKDVTAAGAQAHRLGQSGALAVEMMDYASLRASMPGADSLMDGATAMLIDYGANSDEELLDRIRSLEPELRSLPGLLHMDSFTTTVAERARLWNIRDGVFPCVGGARIPGNAVILEDVVTHVEELDRLVEGVQSLFRKHGYNGAIFGHARDGNIHPLITPDLDDQREHDNFRSFMEDFVDTVLKLDGSLKGEHGTGRAMAPFVPREWGEKIYGMMRRVKQLADPGNTFNPGVIINDDPDAFIRPMKTHGLFGDRLGYDKADRCIECGYCEHVCPTRHITLTPRQRLQALRIMQHNPDPELRKEFTYPGNETCCTDGSCEKACPMGINTAIVTDALRNETNSAVMEKALTFGARNYGAFETTVRAALTAAVATGKVISPYPIMWAADFAHRICRLAPHFSRHFPMPARLHYRETPDPEWIYFPACVTRIFGGSSLGKDDLITVVCRLADRAGLRLSVPRDVHGLCCSQIWEHKGDTEGQRIVANQAVSEFYRLTDSGRIPLLCDTTSCTHTLLTLRHDELLTPENNRKYKSLRIVDICQWLCDEILPRIDVVNPKGSILLHPTCASRLDGMDKYLMKIAEKCAREVTEPYSAHCCGAGGDRGFIFPQVAKAAVRDERKEIGDRQFDGCYSLARTCEISMMDSIDRPYESIVYLVDETTR